MVKKPTTGIQITAKEEEKQNEGDDA